MPWQARIILFALAVGVAPGMVIGEAGAGRGYFTFKLSKKVGETGKVYANDIDEKALVQLRERYGREGINNIETVVGAVVDPLFPVSNLDMVFFVYALHDFTQPVEFLVNLKKIHQTRRTGSDSRSGLCHNRKQSFPHKRAF